MNDPIYESLDKRKKALIRIMGIATQDICRAFAIAIKRPGHARDYLQFGYDLTRAIHNFSQLLELPTEAINFEWIISDFRNLFEKYEGNKQLEMEWDWYLGQLEQLTNEPIKETFPRKKPALGIKGESKFWEFFRQKNTDK